MPETPSTAGKQLAVHETAFRLVQVLLWVSGLVLGLLPIAAVVEVRRFDPGAVVAGGVTGGLCILLAILHRLHALRRVGVHEGGLVITRRKPRFVSWTSVTCIAPVQLVMRDAADPSRYLIDIGMEHPFETRNRALVDTVVTAAGLQWIKLGDGKTVAVRPRQAGEAGGLAFRVLKHAHDR